MKISGTQLAGGWPSTSSKHNSGRVWAPQVCLRVNRAGRPGVCWVGGLDSRGSRPLPLRVKEMIDYLLYRVVEMHKLGSKWNPDSSRS